MTYAVGAGMAFTLANMLFMAAISVSGMALAFPVELGRAVVTGVIFSYVVNPQADPLMLFSGAALVLGAIILARAACTSHVEARCVACEKAATNDPDAPPRRRLPRAARGITLSAAELFWDFSFHCSDMERGQSLLWARMARPCSARPGC